MTLRVFEAFAGVGSQRMALKNLGIDHEVVAIAEIDKFAIKSYEAIHGEVYNLGDISQVELEDIPDHDLFTYSFPCQDISVAGKGLGLDEGSGTRSGLLWECQKVIAGKKPKYLLLENVKNLVGKRHKPNFDKWLEWLEGQGYTNYWEVLNAKDYGIPQNRERVFVVSILGEHEPYKFPEPIELELRLKDVLEEEVDEKFYLDTDKAKKLIATITDKHDIKEITPTDGGLKNPRPREVANAIIARYDAGVSNLQSTGTMVVEPKAERIGGIFDKDGKTHQAGSIWDKEQVSPTLDTMQGGWRQPSVVIGASRGRNPENPSDRTAGSPTEQRLEINKQGTSNTISTVQKDNYVLEGVDVHPFSKKLEFRGYEQKEVSPCLLATDYKAPKTILESQTDSSQDNYVAEAKEEFGRMGRQAVETLNENDVKHGDTIDPFNKRVSSEDGISPTLTTRPEGFKTAVLPVIEPLGTLAAHNSDKFGTGYMEGVSKTLKANKHDISVVERVRRLAETARPSDEIGVTLKENGDIRPHRMDKKKSGIQELNINHEDNPSHTVTSAHMPKVYGDITDFRIRKLTPKECWRLMGFSDEDFHKAEEVNSNTQLYKQAGNSIVVDVLEGIFRQLFKIEFDEVIKDEGEYYDRD